MKKIFARAHNHGITCDWKKNLAMREQTKAFATIHSHSALPILLHRCKQLRMLHVVWCNQSETFSIFDPISIQAQFCWKLGYFKKSYPQSANSTCFEWCLYHIKNDTNNINVYVREQWRKRDREKESAQKCCCWDLFGLCPLQSSCHGSHNVTSCYLCALYMDII